VAVSQSAGRRFIPAGGSIKLFSSIDFSLAVLNRFSVVEIR